MKTDSVNESMIRLYREFLYGVSKHRNRKQVFRRLKFRSFLQGADYVRVPFLCYNIENKFAGREW